MTIKNSLIHTAPSAGPAASPKPHFALGHLPAFVRDPLGFLTHCARDYGGVVPLRFAHKRAFLLTEPADIERALVTEYRAFPKPVWLRTAAVRRLLGEGLVSSDGEVWRRQSQACRPAFHPRMLDGYGETMVALTERMLAAWQPGQSLDLLHTTTHLTLQIAAAALFGVKSFDWTEPTGAALYTLMERFAARRSLFGMVPGLPTAQERRAARRLDSAIASFIHKPARETFSGCPHAAASPDLLTLLQRPTEGGGLAMTGRELHEQVKTFLAAGYESSALTLAWAFLMLARHPEAEARLHRELDAVLGEQAPTPADLPRLPYARAVIQETMRLYPPLWMTGREARSACEIGGAAVPAGALVMTSQWAMHRHPRYFADPDAFRPERWESAETANLPRFAYFPFGGGPRICIAQKFAMMESILVLVTVAQRFRLRLDPAQNLKPLVSMTLRPPKGVRVALEARSAPHFTPRSAETP